MAKKKRIGYQAFEVPDWVRDKLILYFSPSWLPVVGHHVTWVYGAGPDEVFGGIPVGTTVNITLTQLYRGNVVEAFSAHLNDRLITTQPLTAEQLHLTWSFDATAGVTAKRANDLFNSKLDASVVDTTDLPFRFTAGLKHYR